MTRGQDIKRLSSGELVAAGFFYPTPLHFVILRSTDNGATWNATYNDNTVSKKGITLIEAKDSSVIVVGEYNDSPYQIIVMRSTDAGASWSQRSEIYFKQNLWTDLYDLKIDGLGNLWSVGFMKYVDANFKNAWAVIKSSDNGVTWQDSDVFSLAGNHSTASSLAIGPSNEIYAAGTTSATRFSLRSSTDSGMTWSELDNYSVAGATQAFDDTRIAIATNGDVFYAGTSGWPQVVELRKGAVNGTVWSTPVTFPRPGSTDFTLTDMKAFSDGSLWISGLDRQISLYNVIYRSIDNGVTFTEVFREDWGLNEKQELKRLSNGDIYAISGMTIKKTSDNGTTWTLVHDGVTSRILGYTFDSLGRLYVHHNNSDVVVAQNQFNGSWFDVYQYSLLNKYNNRVIKLTNCGNMTQVCLIGYYENAIEGSILEMIPLVVP